MKLNIEKIAVIGAGAWGTALAKLASKKASSVYLLSHDKELVKFINNKLYNYRSLSDITLPTNLLASSSYEICRDADLIIIACKFEDIAQISKKLSKYKLKNNTQIITVSKGINPDTLQLPSEIISLYLPDFPIYALSGPNYAKEVAKRQPTISTLAGDSKYICEIANIFNNWHFTVETTNDLIGAQLCGAIKNVIAIGCGIADGLSTSYNQKAAIFTAGYRELKKVLEFRKASIETASLSCGIGDLFLTCSNSTSRNYSFGHALAKKTNFNEALVEGIGTAKAILKLSKENNLRLPLLTLISEIIEGTVPAEHLNELSIINNSYS